jgi:hypothetical protein
VTVFRYVFVERRYDVLKVLGGIVTAINFGRRKLKAMRSFTGRLLQEEVITLTAEQ